MRRAGRRTSRTTAARAGRRTGSSSSPAPDDPYNSRFTAAFFARWKPTASTSSRTPSRISRHAMPSSGGIFDYDAKKSRLLEVTTALEDPKVWDDAKKAQDLGKERAALEAMVG